MRMIESITRIGLSIMAGVVVFKVAMIHMDRHKHYVYGALGSGKTFWKRLFCRHDWEFLDGYGMNQRCKKCGRFKSWR